MVEPLLSGIVLGLVPVTIAGLFACGQISLAFPNGEVGICAFTRKTLDKITVDCFILIKNI